MTSLFRSAAAQLPLLWRSFHASRFSGSPAPSATRRYHLERRMSRTRITPDFSTLFAGKIYSPNPFWLASAPPTNCGEQVMRALASCSADNPVCASGRHARGAFHG